MKSCRICLNIDTTVSYLGDSEAVKHLQEILRTHGFEKLNSNHYICFICKYLLNKYFSFVKRILRAQQAFRDIKEQRIKHSKFMNLDRSKLDLNLNLSCHSISNFYYGSKIENHNDFVEMSVKKENCDFLSDNPVIRHPLDTSINLNQSNNEGNHKENNESFNKESDIEVHRDLVEIAMEDEYCGVLLDNPVILNPLDTSIKINQSDNEENHEENKSINEDSDIEDRDLAKISMEEENCDVLLDNPVILNPLDTSINGKIQIDYEEKNNQRENITENSDDDSDDDKSIMLLKTQKYKHQMKRKEAFKSKNQIKKNNVAKPKPKIRNVEENEEDQDYIPESDDSQSSRSSNEYFAYAGRIVRRDYRTFPMECDQCDAIVESKQDHFRHYRLYHQDIDYPYSAKSNFVCQHCGKTRTTLKNLQLHEEIHGEKNIACEVCGKKFHTKYLLNRHSIYHRERKFMCDYCTKPFHHRSDLVLHIRTHTGEKPFKCHICGDGFAHKGNVGIHIRAKHQHAPHATSKKPKKTGGKEKNKNKKTNNKRTEKKKRNLKTLKKKSTQKHIIKKKCE